MRPWKWELRPWNWRKVRKARISKQDRDLFERYGESVIGSILAGDVPITPELRAILPHSPPGQPGVLLDKFEEARNWLTECRDLQHRREQRLETVEIGVVALITMEILLSLYFGFRAIHDGERQTQALADMDSSSAATASAMAAVSKSLQSLSDAQAKSLERLNQMSETLRDSLKTNSTMAGATRKQLNILQEEQANRAAELAKKPKLQFYIGSVPVATGPFNALRPPTYPIRDQTDTSLTLDSSILNQGSAPATRVQVRVITSATDVSFSGPGRVTAANEPPDNPFKTWLIDIDLIRQNVNVPMTLTFSFPKGHAAFDVTINVDADGIETATPLGNFKITPRKPAKDESPHTR